MTNDKPPQSLAPDAIQGALALYLKEVQPVDGRAQINISLNELNVLRRLAATPAVGGEREALIGVLAYEQEAAKLKGFSDCTCMGHSRSAESAYEMGECPHQKAHAVLAAPPASQPAVGGLEAMAEIVHNARWPADRQMAVTPFADEDRNGREYCFRIARAVLATQPASPLRGREAALLARIECAIITNDVAYKDMILQQVLVASAAPPEQPAADWRRYAAESILQQAVTDYRRGGDITGVTIEKALKLFPEIKTGYEPPEKPAADPEPELPAARPMGQS